MLETHIASYRTISPNALYIYICILGTCVVGVGMGCGCLKGRQCCSSGMKEKRKSRDGGRTISLADSEVGVRGTVEIHPGAIGDYPNSHPHHITYIWPPPTINRHNIDKLGLLLLFSICDVTYTSLTPSTEPSQPNAQWTRLANDTKISRVSVGV
jgi:hypothetical protein